MGNPEEESETATSRKLKKILWWQVSHGVGAGGVWKNLVDRAVPDWKSGIMSFFSSGFLAWGTHLAARINWEWAGCVGLGTLTVMFWWFWIFSPNRRQRAFNTELGVDKECPGPCKRMLPRRVFLALPPNTLYFEAGVSPTFACPRCYRVITDEQSKGARKAFQK
jgi:hypothetical protein